MTDSLFASPPSQQNCSFNSFIILNAIFLNRTDVQVKVDMSDSFTNYNYVGNTKVSVSIKKNLCQQMHI